MLINQSTSHPRPHSGWKSSTTGQSTKKPASNRGLAYTPLSKESIFTTLCIFTSTRETQVFHITSRCQSLMINFGTKKGSRARLNMDLDSLLVHIIGQQECPRY